MTSVDVVVPVRNEERCLARNIRALHGALRAMPGVDVRIVIADNGSTDATPRVAAVLCRDLPGVGLVHLDAAGRGRALRAVWGASSAEVVAYMDADLSTGVGALPRAVGAVASRRADIAVGSRLIRGSRVQRSLKREVISRAYNAMLRVALGVRFHDAQCGFKVLRTEVAQRLLPSVENQNWFFDTELLVRAERAGLRVEEVPVTWVEDRDSSVALVRTAMEDMRGVMRLRREHPPARGARSVVLRSVGAPLRSTGASAHR